MNADLIGEFLRKVRPRPMFTDEQWNKFDNEFRNQLYFDYEERLVLRMIAIEKHGDCVAARVLKIVNANGLRGFMELTHLLLRYLDIYSGCLPVICSPNVRFVQSHNGRIRIGRPPKQPPFSLHGTICYQTGTILGQQEQEVAILSPVRELPFVRGIVASVEPNHLVTHEQAINSVFTIDTPRGNLTNHLAQLKRGLNRKLRFLNVELVSVRGVGYQLEVIR